LPENCAAWIGGGMVVKAPSSAVVLIVSATKDVIICDSTLAIRLMHVIEAASSRLGHHRFDDKGSQPHVRY
jgi:actin-like ATPase involved in cell morphogenesis